MSYMLRCLFFFYFEDDFSSHVWNTAPRMDKSWDITHRPDLVVIHRAHGASSDCDIIIYPIWAVSLDPTWGSIRSEEHTSAATYLVLNRECRCYSIFAGVDVKTLLVAKTLFIVWLRAEGGRGVPEQR